MTAIPQQRPLRSFVLREGRMTAGQQRAFADYWPRFGLAETTNELELATVFGRVAPLTVEIGFGDGEALLAQAQTHPGQDFLGIEVHRPGVGHLLLRLAELNLTNVRILCADAVTVFSNQLPAGCLDRVNIFFPDPWPKKRHHKRRLIQPDFVALLATKLKPTGIVHLATDWQAYADHMLAVFSAAQEFTNLHQLFAPRPADRPLTKFEQRGLRQGHEVWDLLFQRC